ncbi:unnamed protein product [Cylindrotheca closterium]|uniref:Uncharacterized protein n=1 Tax=Cylindrotheca closterium TaxID=2856 RepID=A0AAD2FKC4_9STRA|nr:unnamed protein product [Cylindrotheca closterium]
MTERRRIRLAAVPYEEEEEVEAPGNANPPQKFRRLAFKDEGAYEPSIEDPKQRMAHVSKESTERKSVSKRTRRQSQKKSRKSKKRGPVEPGNLMEELESTTWSLLKCGRKLIEKSIEEGKVQALKAAMRLRQESDRNYRGRGNTKRRTKRSRMRSEFGHGAVDPSSSEESRSIKSGSSYGSHSISSNIASSYSDGQPSMSLSASSSKSSKKKKNGSMSSRAKLNADASFDSLGENSIIADDSYTTEESLPSQDSSTDNVNSDDDRSIVSEAWTAIKDIVETPEADADRLGEKSTPSIAINMEVLLEPDSSDDSWIQSIKSDSNESFSTALNKELSYHRQMPSNMLQQCINEIKDVSTKGHQRKPTVELSDAEFLKVIRETGKQECDVDQTATTDSDTNFLETIEEPKALDQAPTLPSSPSTFSNSDFLKAMQQEHGVHVGTESSLAEPVLSNTDFVKAMQEENGVEEEVKAAPIAEPLLSNADFLKAMRQENGIADEASSGRSVSSAMSTTDFLKAMQRENGVEEEVEATILLSNADFLKTMQQENGVKDETGATSAAPPLLSNVDFLKALQQENGVETETEATVATSTLPSNTDLQQGSGIAEKSIETHDEQLKLSEDLSNADFLEAMRQSLSVTGGKFEEPKTRHSGDVDSISELEGGNSNEEGGFSDSDFLKAIQDTGVEDDDTFNGNNISTPVQTAINENFLSALKQMGGLDLGNTGMFSLGHLETIHEVDSDCSKSAQSSPSRSPPTSFTLIEEVAVVAMNADGSCLGNEITGSTQSDDRLMSKQQARFGHREQTNSTEALVVTEEKSDFGPGNELPDLKCVSSDESDTHCDRLRGILGVDGSESEKEEDIDDGDTGFMTADDILAEDDTNFFSAGAGDDSHFFSMMTENQGTERDSIGSNDSLDEILSFRNGGEQTATMTSQEASSAEAEVHGFDEAKAELETRAENLDQPENRMVEQLETIPGQRYVECRQDESSVPLADELNKEDIEQRKALIRAIEVDESLTPDEKALLVTEIESGVPIDETSSIEIDVDATSSSESQNGDRDAPEHSRMEINKAIGKKVIQGWTLLDSSCRHCALPLMTDSEATEAACIFCDYSRSMNGGHGTKNCSLAFPPPPPPIANKKSKNRRSRMAIKEAPVDPPSSFVVTE